MNDPRPPGDPHRPEPFDAPGGRSDRRPSRLSRCPRPLDSSRSADRLADVLRRLPRSPGRPAPVPPCPTPGFNGAHYFAEVDPVTLAPAAATGFLRCRWCGAHHPGSSLTAEIDPVRVIREVSTFEIYRPVREAVW